MGDQSVMLVKPLTYMNLSGTSIRDLLTFHRVIGDAAGADELAADDSPVWLRDVLLVIYDDLDLPFGHLRFRTRGSSGGHRGLGSIIQELKTERFSRLKVGIGRDDEQLPENYVLEPLRGASDDELVNAAKTASETIPSWLENGVVASANRYNSNKE
jgi:PTH1 family peptidyl-tRNA hydrolase